MISFFFSKIAEIRNEYSNQLDRERELREHVEKQLNEEQKIRGKQKNFIQFEKNLRIFFPGKFPFLPRLSQLFIKNVLKKNVNFVVN